jgi:hypothetical protein
MTKKARGKSSSKTKKKALPTKASLKGKPSVAVTAKQRPKPPAKSQTPKSIPRNPERVSGVERERSSADTERASVLSPMRYALSIDEMREVVRDEIRPLLDDVEALRRGDCERISHAVAETIKHETKLAKRLILRWLGQRRSGSGFISPEQNCQANAVDDTDRSDSSETDEQTDGSDGAESGPVRLREPPADYQMLRESCSRGERKSQLSTYETILVAMYLHETRSNSRHSGFQWKSTKLDPRTIRKAREFLLSHEWLDARRDEVTKVPSHSDADESGPDESGPDESGPDESGPDESGPDEVVSHVYWRNPVLSSSGRSLAEHIYHLDPERWDREIGSPRTQSRDSGDSVPDE